MRVLTVIDSLETGGAETLVCGAARTLAARDDTVVAIVVLYPILDEAWRLEGTSVPIISLEMRDKRDLRRGARRLQHEIAAFRPDVVHTHLFPADLVTVLATRGQRPRTALVLSHHNAYNRRRKVPLSQRLDEWIYGHFDRIVCVSTVVETSLVAWIPAIESRATVVRNAVELPTDGWDARGPFAFDLLFVGRLFELKGLDLLIDALSLLRAQGMRLSLRVVGEGPRRKEYERRVHQLGLAGQVEFVGRRRNAQELMLRARALVVPSRSEGLSMVMLEAMSLGMPVVATAVSGASEAIRDGWSGSLVRPLDVEGLADGIAALMREPESAKRLGDNAREAIARNFSMSTHVGRLRHVYEQVELDFHQLHRSARSAHSAHM